MPHQTKKIKKEFRELRSWLMVIFVFSLSFALSFLSASRVPASLAANAWEFQAGNIISDAVMANYNSMTLTEIQNFLESKNKCNNTDYDTYLEQTTKYPNITWHWEGEPYNGHFVCLAEEKFGDTPSEIGEGMTAAEIIYEAAQENKINPQVLLVLLQKESSLITDTFPNSLDYSKATGYGCPDTAACDTKYSGFKNQVFRAAELFRYTLDYGSVSYPEGRNVYIGYNPNSSCGGSQVYIENRATASLYRYTPYQPNTAALNAGYGSGDTCSAYGNRNFFLYFTDWFGSTQAAVDGEVTVVPAGTYALLSAANSSLALGMSGSNAELATFLSREDQTWQIRRNTSGYYEIKNTVTEEYLASDGDNIATTKTNTTCATQWQIYRSSDNYLIIESACEKSLVLDTLNSATIAGTNVQLSLASKASTQKWQLWAGETIPSGRYNISSTLDTDLQLSGPSTTSTTSVGLQTADTTWLQQWDLSYNKSTGYYTIKNYKTGQVLDISGATMKNGSKIQLYTSNNTCAQKWKIVGDEVSGYTIISACHDGYVLDVTDGVAINGANIQLWKTNGTAAQKWNFAEPKQVEDGVYIISSKSDTKKNLDLVNGYDRNGTNIQLWSDNDHWAQQWQLTQNTDGTYTIKSVGAAEHVLDVDGSRMVNSTNIKLWSSNGGCAQKWYLEPLGGDYYTFISACNQNYVLDVAGGTAKDGTNAQLYTSNGTNAQIWKLQPVIATTAQTVANGTYKLISKLDTTRGVDLTGAGNYNGANIQLYDLNGTWSQDWNLRYNADGTYSFVNVNASSRVLDVSGGNMVNGANIQLYVSNNTCAQKWHLLADSNNYYTLASACNQDYVLDLSDGVSRNSANIQLWKTNGTAAQKWKLDPR